MCKYMHKLIKQAAKTSNSVVDVAAAADAITVVSGELFVLRNARDKQQQRV